MAKKIVLADQPPVPEEIQNPDVLATFLASSLDLIPRKGKGDVAVKLLQIFTRIAGKRDETIMINGRKIPVKNGAIKVEDLHFWLQAEGVSIGLSQLYTTYLSRLIERGIVVKKKHSMYGLRADRLEDTMMEIERDARSIVEKLRSHAKRLEKALSTRKGV